MTRIAVVLGTAREGRQSEKVAKFVRAQLEADGHEVSFVDVKDFPSPVTVPAWVESEMFAPWRLTASQVEAFVLVVPEYNHSFPGELKILLDSALKEYAKKPVALVGVSGGQYGGARVVDHLKSVVSEIGMISTGRAFLVDNVGDFDPENPTDKHRERFAGLMDEALTYAKALNHKHD